MSNAAAAVDNDFRTPRRPAAREHGLRAYSSKRHGPTPLGRKPLGARMASCRRRTRDPCGVCRSTATGPLRQMSRCLLGRVHLPGGDRGARARGKTPTALVAMGAVSVNGAYRQKQHGARRPLQPRSQTTKGDARPTVLAPCSWPKLKIEEPAGPPSLPKTIRCATSGDPSFSSDRTYRYA